MIGLLRAASLGLSPGAGAPTGLHLVPPGSGNATANDRRVAGSMDMHFTAMAATTAGSADDGNSSSGKTVLRKFPGEEPSNKHS